jgi:hypothetical protein
MIKSTNWETPAPAQATQGRTPREKPWVTKFIRVYESY